MKKITIVIIFLFFVGLFFLSFFLNNGQGQKMLLFTELISALSSFITLIIAILLYNKFGIEKEILTKQTKVVFNLLVELKKMRFVFLRPNNGGLLQVFLDNYKENDFWEYEKDRELLFNFNYFEALSKIFDISNNVFLPREISEKMKLINISTIKVVDEIKNKHLKVKIFGFSNKSNQDERFGILNDKPITLKEYLKIWDDIISATEKWMQKKSAKHYELNFHQKY